MNNTIPIDEIIKKIERNKARMLEELDERIRLDEQWQILSEMFDLGELFG